MTRANLLVYTEAPRARMERWLDELVGDGVLDVDSDDDGELVWTVRGAARSTRGPERLEDALKLADLKAGVSRNQAMIRRVGGLAMARAGAGSEEGEKSVLLSGLLSLVFGPLGWFYAAPLRRRSRPRCCSWSSPSSSRSSC